MSHRALGPMFHGTTEEWAAHIVNNGQRANMSQEGAFGPGLYLTSSHRTANGYAETQRLQGRGAPAVVEGLLDPSARVHDLSDEDDRALRRAHSEQPEDVRREILRFNSRLRQKGYDVIRSGHIHAAIRPNVFLPTRLHYPGGEAVELR